MRSVVLLTALLVFALGGGSHTGVVPRSATARADEKPAPGPVPVQTSMHDFMEGVFQGPYRRLKTGMAAEPKDNAGWKVIRSEALILAEGGNLLHARKPEKDVDQWVKFSTGTRDTGADLYKAAKAKDYAAAKKAYQAMLGQCNACHKLFDDGNHQLTP
ncbi:cytochrome c [Frigoriglobus tundricola]|uniref:Cytochrome c n=1 Tax=Frigoriglobus tundricola TaxID=2774151 RepID=A0A6M5Z1H2_9BACT|nr:cytochrome c [Frigoriglobus tundricola]QJX00200.1 hypothetical protein FTUN_7824 [Frigoriglobus tundricola]